MADKLRLRSNRLLGPPPPYTGIGRPRVHGDKFKLNDPTTWWTPNHLLEVHDKVGTIVPASMGESPFSVCTAPDASDSS